MLGRRFVGLVAIAVLAVITGSCAALVPGSEPSVVEPSFSISPFELPPEPSDPTPNDPTPSATTPTPSDDRDGSWKPERRRRDQDLDLSGMKDCAKLADVPVARWQVRKGRPVAEALETGTVSCSWAHRKPPYALTLLTYQESIYDGHIFSDTEPKEIAVRGFPAWTGERTEGRPTCLIEIDIDDGQYLSITYNVTGPIEDNTVNCDRLPDIGAELVDALLDQ